MFLDDKQVNHQTQHQHSRTTCRLSDDLRHFSLAASTDSPAAVLKSKRSASHCEKLECASGLVHKATSKLFDTRICAGFGRARVELGDTLARLVRRNNEPAAKRGEDSTSITSASGIKRSCMTLKDKLMQNGVKASDGKSEATQQQKLRRSYSMYQQQADGGGRQAQKRKLLRNSTAANLLSDVKRRTRICSQSFRMTTRSVAPWITGNHGSKRVLTGSLFLAASIVIFASLCESAPMPLNGDDALDDNSVAQQDNIIDGNALQFAVERRRLNRDRALEPPSWLREQPMRRGYDRLGNGLLGDGQSDEDGTEEAGFQVQQAQEVSSDTRDSEGPYDGDNNSDESNDAEQLIVLQPSARFAIANEISDSKPDDNSGEDTSESDDDNARSDDAVSGRFSVPNDAADRDASGSDQNVGPQDTVDSAVDQVDGGDNNNDSFLNSDDIAEDKLIALKGSKRSSPSPSWSRSTLVPSLWMIKAGLLNKAQLMGLAAQVKSYVEDSMDLPHGAIEGMFPVNAEQLIVKLDASKLNAYELMNMIQNYDFARGFATVSWPQTSERSPLPIIAAILRALAMESYSTPTQRNNGFAMPNKSKEESLARAQTLYQSSAKEGQQQRQSKPLAALIAYLDVVRPLSNGFDDDEYDEATANRSTGERSEALSGPAHFWHDSATNGWYLAALISALFAAFFAVKLTTFGRPSMSELRARLSSMRSSTWSIRSRSCDSDPGDDDSGDHGDNKTSGAAVADSGKVSGAAKPVDCGDAAGCDLHHAAARHHHRLDDKRASECNVDALTQRLANLLSLGPLFHAKDARLLATMPATAATNCARGDDVGDDDADDEYVGGVQCNRQQDTSDELCDQSACAASGANDSRRSATTRNAKTRTSAEVDELQETASVCGSTASQYRSAHSYIKSLIDVLTKTRSQIASADLIVAASTAGTAASATGAHNFGRTGSLRGNNNNNKRAASNTNSNRANGGRSSSGSTCPLLASEVAAACEADNVHDSDLLMSQMDISAAHIILACMEQRLVDKQRLRREWLELTATTHASAEGNNNNKTPQHAKGATHNNRNNNANTNNNNNNNRVKLSSRASLKPIGETTKGNGAGAKGRRDSGASVSSQTSIASSVRSIAASIGGVAARHASKAGASANNTAAQIDASYIYDTDPKRPTHIIASSPTNEQSCAQFWQMIWEQEISVIVMLTRLNESGSRMCSCYWPNMIAGGPNSPPLLPPSPPPPPQQQQPQTPNGAAAKLCDDNLAAQGNEIASATNGAASSAAQTQSSTSRRGSLTSVFKANRQQHHATNGELCGAYNNGAMLVFECVVSSAPGSPTHSAHASSLDDDELDTSTTNSPTVAHAGRSPKRRASGASVTTTINKRNADDIVAALSNQITMRLEVHLISEHVTTRDYVVRNMYLVNKTTGESRTITQFHYLAWPLGRTPSEPRSLLEFRRKVHKSHRSPRSPLLVHCNDGKGRSGTYTLLDIILERIKSGAKEVDPRATLEQLREQRAGLCENLQQFEFVLAALADEIQLILNALPQ